DGFDDAFPHARNDRLFCRPADEAIKLGTHRDTGTRLELNAVAADAFEHRFAFARVGTIDDAGVDINLHGFEDISAGQLNGLGDVPRQGDARFVRGDDRL